MVPLSVEIFRHFIHYSPVKLRRMKNSKSSLFFLSDCLMIIVIWQSHMMADLVRNGEGRDFVRLQEGKYIFLWADYKYLLLQLSLRSRNSEEIHQNSAIWNWSLKWMKKEGQTCLRQGRNINYLKTCKRGHGWPKLKKIRMDFNSFFLSLFL